ncbi:DNA mismatch repair protein MutS2 [Desulfobaculum xiamenense]|uniref:Endonuclease MutS2 n=1 Tax=Desulfobaculum xiamenense TaxID=995050 RepID=A0A846QK81_9BACT|nr:Smr/MutS family protein [Desulfobaculum xiamenense]NJB66882.1 DNA mismatch repair protein MutS2 [Desulfobaculum xiamenense]
MESRTLQLLEFPKVLELVAGYCASESGAQRVLAIRPFEDSLTLAHELDLLRQWLTWNAETRFKLGTFPPLDGLFEHLGQPSAVLDLDALWAVSEVLGTAREAREVLERIDEERFPLLAALVGRNWPQKLWSALRRCLGRDGNIRDEASPELFSVRQEIRQIHSRCYKRVKEFIENEGLSNFLQDDFVTISSDRYVIPLKTGAKGRVRGVIHDYSQTGETCYCEPLFLVDMNNQLQDFKQEEREAEREVLRFLTDLARQEYDELEGAYEFLITSDMLAAKTSFAGDYDARTIEIGEGSPLNLRTVRHPLLMKTGGHAIPVDIVLHEGQRALIISGGNAGGKTVCLKTMGLAALMALSALPVSADEGSSMPAWGRIFVVLGDEQSIEDSLSTFTAQIKHLSGAFAAIDDRTLVIMDEFGAGTDPSQGAALAQAVVDSVLDKGAWLGVATHFPALKAYALSREGVRAASVLFHPVSKKPLYQLAYDQVGASQALDVAREHGLPEEILQRAEQYLLLDGSDTSRIVERLNELAVARANELSALEEERHKLHDKRLRFSERYEREKKVLMDEIRAQAQSVLQEWNKGRIGHKEARRKLAEARQSLAGTGSGVAAETPIAPAVSDELAWTDVTVGGTYGYAAWGKNGVVQEKDDRRQRVKLDMGGVAVWVGLSEIAPQAKQGGTVRPAATGTANVRKSASLSLDLRGMRADAALAELARYIDGAVLSGHHRVEIVHGRGTGALRREVHEFLRTFPPVDSYSLAPEDQGGDGMTIVELK